MATAASTTLPDAAQKGPPSPWIHNPWADLFIGGGLWSLPLLAVFYFASQANVLAVSVLFYGLSVFCNNPHYMATIFRAYSTRADFCKYRFFTVYITMLMAFTALLVHWLPQALPWIFTLYITWSPWHYTGQNYGIAMMFARRAGARPSKLERNLIFYSYVASYGVWFLAMHGAIHDDPYVISLGIPPRIADVLSLACVAVFLGCGGYGLIRLAAQVGWRKLVGTTVLFSTQFLWFVAAELLQRLGGKELSPVYYSAGILAFMHCAQYLWITSYYAKKETEAGARGRHRKWNPVGYYTVLVVGGLALFVPAPWLVSALFNQSFVLSYLTFVSLVNLHHFILDGAIWKLRDGRIARLLLGSKAGAESGGEAKPVANWLFRLADWVVGQTGTARALRIGFALCILGIGVVDQLQNYLTTSARTLPRLELAQLLNPRDIRVYQKRATLLHDQGKTGEAIAELREAVKINPRDPLPQGSLAQLLAETGQIAEAQAIFTRLGSQLDTSYDAQVTRAVLAAREGDVNGALKFLDAAVRIDSERPEALVRKGDALTYLGRADEAVAPYTKYVQLVEKEVAKSPDPHQPSQQRADALRVRLLLGSHHVARGNFQAALPLLAKATEEARELRRPEVFRAATHQLALACERGGDPARAHQWAAAGVMAALEAEDPVLGAQAWYDLATLLKRIAPERPDLAWTAAKASVQQGNKAPAEAAPELPDAAALVNELTPKVQGVDTEEAMRALIKEALGMSETKLALSKAGG
jgi:tetratricopeptide (TPR) repeat protein